MSRILLLAVSLLGLSFSDATAQKLQNGDFSKGRAGWLGDGVVVFLDASGQVQTKETPDSTRALKIDLKKTQWTEIRQALRPLAKDTAVAVSFAVKAATDFLPALESRAYSGVDFREGGSYVWSAEVWPKCDLLVRVQDETWYYRLFSLKPLDAWKTINVSFDKLKSRSRSFTIAFPPGSGSVLIRDIK